MTSVKLSLLIKFISSNTKIVSDITAKFNFLKNLKMYRLIATPSLDQATAFANATIQPNPSTTIQPTFIQPPSYQPTMQAPLAIQPMIQPPISVIQNPPTIQPVYLPTPSTTVTQYQPRPRPYRPRARRFRPYFNPRHARYQPRNPQPALTPTANLPRAETITTSTTDNHIQAPLANSTAIEQVTHKE